MLLFLYGHLHLVVVQSAICNFKCVKEVCMLLYQFHTAVCQNEHTRPAMYAKHDCVHNTISMHTISPCVCVIVMDFGVWGGGAGQRLAQSS